MGKTVKHFWNRVRKPVLVIILMIGIGLGSYGAGTFFPNFWVENNIIQKAKASFQNEWKAFGFVQPSIEYTNDIEFISGVGRCVDFLNMTIEHEQRVPKMIIIAMAVLETGYGKSRFAVEGNNLFGYRTWDPKAPQMKPLELPDAEFGVKKYKTKCDSVKDMIRNVNEYHEYEEYRVERAKQLDSGKIDLDKQIDLLSEWSTNPEYTKLVKMKVNKIKNILAKNKLAK